MFLIQVKVYENLWDFTTLTRQLVNGFPNGRHVKHPYGADSFKSLKNKHAQSSYIDFSFLIQLNNKLSVKLMFVLGHYELEKVYWG